MEFTTPLSSRHIQTLTDADPSLSRIRWLVQEGWPDNVTVQEDDQESSLYAKRRFELSVEGGVCCGGVGLWYWGKRRNEHWVHGSHPGMAKMKSLARSW